MAVIVTAIVVDTITTVAPISAVDNVVASIVAKREFASGALAALAVGGLADTSVELLQSLASEACDNIHSWISLSGDLAFSHRHGIYGFKSPKRFLEIASRDLTLFSILII